MQDSNISRRRLLRLATTGGVASVAGCTGGQETDTDGNGGGDGDDKQQLKQSATIALQSDPTADNWGVYGGVTPYYTNILEPLIWVSNDLKPQPWLATEWEQTGEKTFEFTLRDDVKFHNGKPLTAKAVVFSFKQILNEWAWAAGWLHVKSDGISKVDDSTVKFELTDPYPAFPGTVAHNMVAIQHPDRDRESKKIIGTGPYQVESMKSGQLVKTSAFEDYWNDSPSTKELTFRVMTDPNTRSLALQNHEVDVAFGPPHNKVNSLQDSKKTNVTKKLAPHAAWVEINTETAPTDDLQLRKGLNYAVSQQNIVGSVLNGIGKPATGMIAPSIYWSAHDSLPEYGPDKEKAQQRVEQSDYDGQTLQLVVDNVEPVNGDLIAQVIQQAANELGVTVEIEMLEPASYDQAQRDADGHLFLTSGGTNSAAADYLLYDFFVSKEAGGCCSSWYQLGDRFDSLVIKGNQSGDPEVKKETYGKAQQIMLEKAAIIPLYYQEYVVGTYKDIDGLDLRPIAEMSRWDKLKHRK